MTFVGDVHMSFMVIIRGIIFFFGMMLNKIIIRRNRHS